MALQAIFSRLSGCKKTSKKKIDIKHKTVLSTEKIVVCISTYIILAESSCFLFDNSPYFIPILWHILTEKKRKKNPPHLSCSFSIFFARSTCRASRSSESMESSWREGRSSKKTEIKSEANNYNPSKWFGFVKEIWWNLSKPSSMYSTKQVWRHGHFISNLCFRTATTSRASRGGASTVPSFATDKGFCRVYLEVFSHGGTQQPWGFLLKMIILGCEMGVPPFKETPHL